MGKWNKNIEDIFKAKKVRRKKLSDLPVEEKFKVLIQLQKIAAPIVKSGNLSKKPWGTTTFRQIESKDLGSAHMIFKNLPEMDDINSYYRWNFAASTRSNAGSYSVLWKEQQ